ncbi:hypothetical protein E1B28_009467 [Marasmius oreades]|uniref:CCHC-type domain-containing protein n=1 Tax=Marasmius oreades TaxID=181124 RepID=A0A9P7UQ53_9AGAR|nr:uncharacterized protein E1B28_009467 [Marasmius oreades]KAG7090347.1 hypothetical protein E1B28_009467 [Marasmius oreades]
MPINITHITFIQHCPKLTKDNFAAQEKYWKKFFIAINARYVVELADEVPPEKKAIDDELAFIIQNFVHPDFQHLIEDDLSGLASWKKIRESFVSSTFQAKIQAYKAFISITHDDESPSSAYIHHIDSAAKRLKDLNVPQSDDTVMCLLAANFRHLETRAKLYGLSAPTLDSVKQLLLASADLSEEVDGEEVRVKKEEGAAVARSGYQSRSGNQFGGSSGGASRPPSGQRFRWCSAVANDQCRRCGLNGHIAERCIYDMPQEVKDWVMQGAPRQNRLPDLDGPQANLAHGSEIAAAILAGDLDARAPDWDASYVYHKCRVTGTINMIEEHLVTNSGRADIVGRPLDPIDPKPSSLPPLHT